MSIRPGDRVRGTTYEDRGPVEVTGIYAFRTDDPEEFWQDIVIRTDPDSAYQGRLVYCDEQDVMPA